MASLSAFQIKIFHFQKNTKAFILSESFSRIKKPSKRPLLQDCVLWPSDQTQFPRSSVHEGRTSFPRQIIFPLPFEVPRQFQTVQHTPYPYISTLFCDNFHQRAASPQHHSMYQTFAQTIFNRVYQVSMKIIPVCTHHAQSLLATHLPNPRPSPSPPLIPSLGRGILSTQTTHYQQKTSIPNLPSQEGPGVCHVRAQLPKSKATTNV